MKSVNSICYAILVFLILGAQLGCTATKLPPYEATYTTKLKGIKVTGTRKFEQVTDNQFKVSWRAKALWMSLHEWSEFELIENNQLRPISYHYTRKGLGSDKPIHIVFDWEHNIVNASKGKKTVILPLSPGTQDKLSYQLQMQLDLLRNPKRKSFSYPVASHNKIRNYDFTLLKEESLTSKLGTESTLVFQRQKRDTTTAIWLSPNQYYLPLKVERNEDGKTSVLKIKSWKSESVKKRGSGFALQTNNLNNSGITSPASGPLKSIVPASASEATDDDEF